MKDFIMSLDASSLAWLSGVIVAGLTTAVQTLSKRYKPWSWLAKKLGNAINSDVIDKLNKQEKKIENLESMNERQDATREEDKALDARRRILRFSDEIRRKDKHSKEMFNDVLADITNYKRYCREHPDFENDKAVLSIGIIENTYEKCIVDNDFL